MEYSSLKIVKHLAKVRELELRELSKLLPIKTKDHLDYYRIASLIKSGYVDIYLRSGEKPFHEDNEMQIAIFLYMWVVGGSDSYEYMGIRTNGSDFGKEKVFITAKAYFLLDEIRSKRRERLWAISVGILTAFFATIFQRFSPQFLLLFF